ncbi:hypothetical protein [Methylobacterium sp. JK268]
MATKTKTTSSLTAEAKGTTGNAVTYNASADDPFAPKVSAGGEQVVVPPGFKLVKARAVRPHVSVYLHPRVIAAMKDIAGARGVKVHDVYLDAIRSFLATHGQEFDKLNAD